MVESVPTLIVEVSEGRVSRVSSVGLTAGLRILVVDDAPQWLNGQALPSVQCCPIAALEAAAPIGDVRALAQTLTADTRPQ